ncbi:MAG: heme NO-binding domain-containing protein [Selenomonadaceae bacterium]
MKGTVVATWIETSKKLWSESTVNTVMEKTGWQPDRLFLPLEDIEDSKIEQFIKGLSQATNIPTKKIWYEIGRDNIISFSNAYPSFFKGKTLYTFLASMYDVHVEVVKKIAGAKPPKLIMTPLSEYDAFFSYDSQRGLLDYFKGLLTGTSEHFHEELHMEILEETTTHLKLKLHFAKPILREKTFYLNKLFGFTGSLAAKIGILSFIISLIPTFIFSLFTDSAKVFLLPFLNAFCVWLAAAFLLRPMNTIKKELTSLIEYQYFDDLTLHSKDEFEELAQKIQTYKKRIKAEFTGFRGTSDELTHYGSDFNHLAENMGKTSDEIVTVINEVAVAATSGAENTSSVAGFLNQNMEALQTVVTAQVKNNDNLIHAVDNIDNGFLNVRSSSQTLNKSMEKFKIVQQSAESLRDETEKIIAITALVTQIAARTNLLAFNAAIEAASAGEQGRGFAVVAEEIRTLAEQSHNQAAVISNDIQNITKIINEVVSSVSLEYEVLGQESTQLIQVVENNSQHVENIRGVSLSISQIIDRLRQEMENMNHVFEKVESIAAMSEENSAAAQEVNATVHIHNEKLQDMMDKIQHFKKISSAFSKELSTYKI